MPTLQYPAPPQFSPEHIQEIEIARKRMSKINFACAIAKLDGSCILGFGILSVICGITDVVGFLVGVGLIVIGYLEIRFAGQLKSLQKGAAKSLAINQCALSLLVILYALLQLLGGPSKMIQTQLQGVSSPEIENLLRGIFNLFYTLLIAIAIILWGGQAYYYHTREKHVRALNLETPPWLLKMIHDKVISL
jgi:hypothetical protein